MSSIMFSPFTSIFENKSAGTMIVGSPGSGKTFFINNIITNAIIMEQKIFAIDMKNDISKIKNEFPHIVVTDVNKIQPGGLNPFKVVKEVDTNFITSLISIICNGVNDQQIVSITPIINDFVNKFKRDPQSQMSFADVADYLYANDSKDAQVIGTKLNIHRDSQYGSLLFDEDEEIMKLDNRSKVISLHGMDLPKQNDQHMTEEQKFNSGIVFILCKMLQDLMLEGTYPKLFILDEAHIAFQNEAFASIINKFLTLGRSLNIATILSSQSVTHYPQNIGQLISSKFCFKSDYREAMEFLEMFLSGGSEGKADFPVIASKINTFEKPGQSFFVDSSNRSGFFKVANILNNVSSNPLGGRK